MYTSLSVLLHLATVCTDISKIIFLFNLKFLIIILQIISSLLGLVFINSNSLELLIQILIQDSNKFLLHTEYLSILHQFFLRLPFTLNPPTVIMQENEYSLSKLTSCVLEYYSFSLTGIVSFLLFMFLFLIFKNLRFDIVALFVIILHLYAGMGVAVQLYLSAGLNWLQYILFFLYYLCLMFLIASMIFLFLYILWKIGGKFHSAIVALFYFYFFLHVCYIILGKLLIYTNFNLIIFVISLTFLITMVIYFCMIYLHDLK